MMQIKTVHAVSGNITKIDEVINDELRRLGKKAFAIQYHHYFHPDEGKKGTSTMRILAHIQYEEPES